MWNERAISNPLWKHSARQYISKRGCHDDDGMRGVPSFLQMQDSKLPPRQKMGAYTIDPERPICGAALESSRTAHVRKISPSTKTHRRSKHREHWCSCFSESSKSKLSQSQRIPNWQTCWLAWVATMEERGFHPSVASLHSVPGRSRRLRN